MGELRSGEEALVGRARSGDPDAWEAVYRRVYPRLFTFARRRLPTDEQAEDAVSETMARAIDLVERYQPGPAGLDGWIFGIARNVLHETHRRERRLTPVDPETVSAADHDRQRDRPADPATVVAEEAERSVMAQAFAELSADDQDVLELRVVLGLDAAQVAALTRRRPGAVRMAQSRALQRLATRFERLMT